jgi:hypothetical protein
MDLRGGNRFHSGVCSGRSTAYESDGGDDGNPGEQDSGEIEALLIPDQGH